MDWTAIVSAVASFLLAMSGSGVLFWSQSKKLKQLEVRKGEQELQMNELQEWKEIANKREAELERKDAKINEIRKERNGLQKDNGELSVEVAKLKGEIEVQRGRCDLEVEKLKFTKCLVRGCKLRQPPHWTDENGNEVMSPE